MSKLPQNQPNPRLPLNTFQFWTACKPKSFSNTGDLDLLSVYLDRGVIPYSEGGGLVHKPAEDLSAYQVVDVGDFVLNNQQAWRGSVGVSPYKGIVSPAYLIYSLDKKKLDPVFCNYLFRDKFFVDKLMQCSMSVGDIQRQVKQHLLRKIEISVPEINSQKALGLYLDRETTRIDALVEKKTRFIELLREKRQALITHAVTKGLDPNVKMKDSGVEWLGEVPEDWSVTKIKRIISAISQGWSPECDPRVPEFDEWGVLKVGCVNGGEFKPFESKVLPVGLEPRAELALRKGDVLVSRANTRELVGSCAVVDKNYPKLMLCDKLYRLITDAKKVLPEFLAKLIAVHGRKAVEIEATGASSSMVNISQSVILDLAVALPPISEQENILQEIRISTFKIDGVIEKTERSIELLKERRSALITAAVTGQIDLREAA